MSETKYPSARDLPTAHLLGAGTAMCAGCGGLEAVHEIYDVLGKNTVFVNAAGCMSLLSIYPFTPFRSSWLYTAMASAPAGAQGIRDALDIRLARGEIQPEDDLQVVVLSGDGAAYGMGLSATSAAIDRGLDFIYLCYDNEGYANTGQQTSAGSPHGARTATDPQAGGVPGYKKDLFSIWTANRPAYAATVIGSEPLDLARKIEKAKEISGPCMILALAPCPTGWGYSPSLSVEIGRLAVRTGIWPLKEYVDGKVTHTRIPGKRLPVEAYLKPQKRFEHLFKPEPDARRIAEIQASVDAYWQEVES
jgi:pyruvate ferredoxin oxidoreductase beta subunit